MRLQSLRSAWAGAEEASKVNTAVGSPLRKCVNWKPRDGLVPCCSCPRLPAFANELRRAWLLRRVEAEGEDRARASTACARREKSRMAGTIPAMTIEEAVMEVIITCGSAFPCPG